MRIVKLALLNRESFDELMESKYVQFDHSNQLKK
jgi:hypothetical protein